MPIKKEIGPYKVIRVNGFRFFHYCEESEVEDRAGDPDNKCYPIKEIDDVYQSTVNVSLIIGPGEELWLEGNLFLLSRAKEYPPLAEETLHAEASHLADFMNVMYSLGVDYRNFNGRKFELPTYLYKAHFKGDVACGRISVGTANNKIRPVIRFYRFEMSERSFFPKNSPWQSRVVKISYPDRVGVLRTREVITTDLIFSKTSVEEDGSFINDGGRLVPLDFRKQIALHEALDALGNTEMQLSMYAALVSGAREQTIFTLRCGDIVEGGEEDKALYPIRVGAGTLVDTKYNKPQVIYMPGWMHNRIYIYLHSDRYLRRKSRAKSRPDDEQYVFLSKSGKPYYVAQADKNSYESHEKGSAVRAFIKDSIIPMLANGSEPFTFSFHDLRATFGMNLVEERMPLLEGGKISLLELLDYVRGRLCHESSITTMRYLDYRRINKLTYQADINYQVHILSFTSGYKFDEAC